ncbi:ABC transporter ATP-binding protein [Sphaerisporangium melleum]|uniref:ABC transporter ATP-binding protein n=1 Tax=Sphaerisporangium melleum TaxID=321316 RepID=A0A917VTR6_9ACTN|nr:ABC transporter ATP-binding protein [Sphaerisporangium melleum]GII74837.1 ABC transporter ATP-binding protein [Sphaerisporangium melleum]
MSPGAAFRELRIRGLGRRFGNGFTALDGLDLDIGGGEFIALLGPSGCGKSTALNLLAGLLAPTRGSIWIDEQRVDTLPPEKRNFGMVFQNYALFPHLTVAENVAFGLRMRKVGKAERAERVRKALELVRLTEQAGKHPGQLSGGQQQRVAIARAIVVRPRLVLMDEPLSNLDAKLRLDMRTEIRLLHQELSLTTVYVTHDQAEALSLADRLVVMRAGVVQQIGRPSEVYERPANAFVAAFVGYRNALPGRLIGADVEIEGLGRIRHGDGDLPAEGEAVAMIRPDDLVIGGPEAGRPISLTVRVCEYQGRSFAVEGRAPDGTVLHAASLEPLAPGDHVSAHIRPERIRVFPRADQPNRADPAPAESMARS